RYHGRSIADVLNMRVHEALELFGNLPKIRRLLQTTADVGLDYLALGQAAPTLSGGEAQRVKLAAELARPSTGRTLYVLDELRAGPHQERRPYDPQVAEATRPDDVALEDVGQGAAMPWETDGRRWHTAERVTTEGKAARWEGAILDWLDEQVHQAGEFADTNWDQRTVVEDAAPNRTHGGFLHAQPGRGWCFPWR